MSRETFNNPSVIKEEIIVIDLSDDDDDVKQINNRHHKTGAQLKECVLDINMNRLEMKEMKKQMDVNTRNTAKELEEMKMQLAANAALVENVCKALREGVENLTRVTDQRAEKFETRMFQLFSNKGKSTNMNNTDEEPCHSRRSENSIYSRPTTRTNGGGRKQLHVQEVNATLIMDCPSVGNNHEVGDQMNTNGEMDNGFITLTDGQIRSMSKNTSFQAFICQLLMKSFPNGYFITHTLRDVTEQQIDILYNMMSSQPSSVKLSVSEFKSILTKKINSYQKEHKDNLQKQKRHLNNDKARNTNDVRHDASGLTMMSATDLANLANDSKSCVLFIGKLILKVFRKNYFLSYTFKDVTGAQIDAIYRMVRSQYLEIQRRGKPAKSLERDDIVSVLKQKIHHIRHR